MNINKFLVKPGSKVKLADWDPGDTYGVTKEAAAPRPRRLRCRQKTITNCLVNPGPKVKRADWALGDTYGATKEAAAPERERDRAKWGGLQGVLSAGGKRVQPEEHPSDLQSPM